MPRSSRPLGQSEFAVALRALHERAGSPGQVAIGVAVGRTHSCVGLILRGEYTPPWDTASAIVEALGGDPARFRAAWEASDPKTRGERVRPAPSAPGLRALIARHDRLGDDMRAWMAASAPPAGASPGRLAGYKLGAAGERSASVWHGSAGCPQAATVHDLGEAVEWALDHERKVHGDGT
jgi:hypothetical protein